MHANFQLSKLIFVGVDRFFLWILGSKIAIFWQILTKLTTLKGQKILKNQNFKICCVVSLNHLSISLQNQNWQFCTSRSLKKLLFKCKNLLFLKMCDFSYICKYGHRTLIECHYMLIERKVLIIEKRMTPFWPRPTPIPLTRKQCLICLKPLIQLSAKVKSSGSQSISENIIVYMNNLHI